jgi:glycosyltransferase involved in cell wall biosynthesis
MFLYWGRRGAMSRFALEVGRAAIADRRIVASISVSRQNETFASFAELGPALFPINTFRSNAGAVLQSWRIPFIRRRLVAYLTQQRIQMVIELMPHVWSARVASAIKQAGARYISIIHDAGLHPGDYRSRWAQVFVNGVMSRADLLFTLSQSVALRLKVPGKVSQAKVITLFHPDLSYDCARPELVPKAGEPLRLLFLGRIMSYKNLPLFLDAVDLLRAQGLRVQIGVFGEGVLGASEGRLRSMGAEVVNRWLSDEEVGAILPRFHAVVLSHTEASQSGVAAAAFGAGLPVVATPVGGLIEQVSDGVNGVLASRADASALADAIRRLLLDERLYRTTCQNIAKTRGERSMTRFVEDCVSKAFLAYH